MTTTSDIPTQPTDGEPTRGVPRLPSPRVTAALAAGMLGLGVAVGAAIGPAPSASLAGEHVAPLLLPAIAALAVTGSGAHTGSAPVEAPAIAPRATPTAASASAGGTGADTARSTKSKTPPHPVVSPTSPPSTSKTPVTTGGGNTKQKTLPPVTSVWLITLSGATFAQALAQPAAAPYIDTQLVPAGALLSGWSSLAAASFASEAALLAGAPPQTLDAIVEPPCPEGAARAQCAPETPGALSAADEFLKTSLPAIMASAAYREHGLIVITFGAVGNATASSLSAGSSTATLSTQPPAGALLISPFAHAGSRPASAFNPTSPKQSLAGLLH